MKGKRVKKEGLCFWGNTGKRKKQSLVNPKIRKKQGGKGEKKEV